MKYFLIAALIAVSAVALVEISAMAVDSEPRHHHRHANFSNGSVDCDQVTNMTTQGQKFQNATCDIGCIIRYLFKGIQAQGCLVNGTCTCYGNSTSNSTSSSNGGGIHLP